MSLIVAVRERVAAPASLAQAAGTPLVAVGQPSRPVPIDAVFSRTLYILGICLLAFAGGPVHAQGLPLVSPVPAAPRLPELKHFNLRLFEIPYDWTGGSRPSAATSVKLYVSADQGVSWQEISSARPEVQFFRY